MQRPTPGRERRRRLATRPHHIRPDGFLAVARRVKDEVRNDHVALLAAGVAFYGFLSLAPALVAAVTIYGLVADPADVADAVSSVLAAAPEEVRAVVESQLTRVARTSSSTLGWTTAIALLVAIWGASRAMASLTEALNVAYDTAEHRGFVVKRALGIGLTLGGLVFVAAAVFTIAVLPRLFEDAPAVVQTTVRWGRWPLLALAFVVALAVLYRLGPNRERTPWHWVSWGAVVAGALWLLVSSGFAVFASSFGSYDETYGSLASVVVLLLWLWLTAIAVLMGAEVNAELEREAARQNEHGRTPAAPAEQVVSGGGRSVVPRRAVRLAATALAGLALGRVLRP